MGLKEQIEAWPAAMRAAAIRVAEATAAHAQVDLDMSIAEMAARIASNVLADSSRAQPGSNGMLTTADATKRNALNEMTEQKSKAEEAAWQARDDVNRAKASADVRIRQEAEAAGKKLTEAAIRARVQIHPDVEAAERRWRDSQAQMTAMRQQVYSPYLLRETINEGPGLSADGEPYDQEAAEEAAQEAAASHGHVRELQQKRVDLTRQLELANAEFAYQRAVGKSLSMLTKIAVVQLANRQPGD